MRWECNNIMRPSCVFHLFIFHIIFHLSTAINKCRLGKFGAYVSGHNQRRLFRRNHLPVNSRDALLPRRNAENDLLLLIGDRKYVDCSPPAPFFICSTKKSPFCVVIAICE